MVPGIRPQNLNDIFQAAAKQARQRLPDLTHNQKVRKGQCPETAMFRPTLLCETTRKL
jgi:hypothetical protein